MEHTGVYHLKLANYLYENDYKVAVINPFSIKKFIEVKVKIFGMKLKNVCLNIKSIIIG
jgi:transposase